MTKIIRSIFVITTLILAFSACSSPAGGNDSYTINFDANGGIFTNGQTIITVKIQSGGVLTPPADPTHLDFSFGGWATEAYGGELFVAAVQNNQTLYARWVLGSIAEVEDYLESKPGGNTYTDPIYLPIQFDLGNMPESGSGWKLLLGVIKAKGKYVELDLSNCTMDGTAFNPDRNFPDGKDRIVSIILLEVAESIVSGTTSTVPFNHFSYIKNVSGSKIKSIGDYAFSGCPIQDISFPLATTIGNYAFASTSLQNASFPLVTTIGMSSFFHCNVLQNVNFPLVTTIGEQAFRETNIQSASFPQATTIGESAFYLCQNLQSASFPKATTIGNSAFYWCQNLQSASFPQATTIEDHAFRNCGDLQNVSFPKATTIWNSVFSSCISLQDVSIPKATTIGNGAFGSCIALQEISFPQATTIGESAFAFCTNLQDINLPQAASIGNYVFIYTGTTSLTITLGNTIPTVGINTFLYVTSTKTVKTLVPAGSTGYGDSPTNTTADIWGNGFRGKGWNGTNCMNGTVNSNIILTIEKK